MAYLELRGITTSYSGNRVIDSLDLSVTEGELIALLGPSGCGKSTTLRVISGLKEMERGSIYMGGTRIDGIPVNRRRIGFVFQNYSLFPCMNVIENITFGMKSKRRSERKARAMDLLDMVDMMGMENRGPGELSGGQKQRIALARALATKPDILLLDEPFGALDAVTRKRIRRDLKSLQRDIKMTTIFVTHDQDEAFEMGDRTAIMNRGRIEQIGRPRDLYDDPLTPFVAMFVGTMNVIQCNNGSEKMVRPEDIELSEDKELPKGIVKNYTFYGHSIDLELDTGEKKDLHVIMSKKAFIESGIRRGDSLGYRFTTYRTA